MCNKNLNFCLTPGRYNKSTLKEDLESFNRKIKLKAFFHNKTNKNKKANKKTKNQILKVKKNLEPKKNHHTVETFIEAVNKDIVERISDKNELPKIIQHTPTKMPQNNFRNATTFL